MGELLGEAAVRNFSSVFFVGSSEKDCVLLWAGWADESLGDVAPDNLSWAFFVDPVEEVCCVFARHFLHTP